MFAYIKCISDDRTHWKNKHAHIEDAGRIKMLSLEITALAARREVLESELLIAQANQANEQEKYS